MINNDDEYAFPLKEPMTSDTFGMTLRDYFAAKAMHGLIVDHVLEAVPRLAFEMADAMLAERKRFPDQKESK